MAAAAGGMLMGAVANMAPDLFAGIIAEVPFVDVLTTMLDATLPLTPPEWPEWGNPIESAATTIATIAAYSPYDNVRAASLSAHPGAGRAHRSARDLLGAGEMGGEAARARRRATLLLLRTNMEAGHAGASGRFDRLKEVALAYAFALKITGRTELRAGCG